MRTILVSFAVATLGCSAQLTPADRQPGPVTVTRLRAEPYSFMYSSQVRNAERLVIRDVAAWHAAWASLFPANAPIPVPPNVDFAREMVVFVALGEHNT